MDKPLQPGGGGRPGIGRPDVPNIGDRINVGNQINIGNINTGNKVINNRPNWVNIDNNRMTNINNRWRNQIGGNRDWYRPRPDRVSYWRGWGDGVRDHWHHHQYGYFGADWWRRHPHGCGGWHYGYGFDRHPWNYWWTVPTFAACTNWFTWSAPAGVWAEPIYYDYGSGGNVVYENNVVYINNEQVATADEFAQSAAALATVPPPASEEEAAAVEWMPLGTFAVATNEKDVDPICAMQLAVSQQGIISGTLYNTGTDQAYSLQGRVDSETQRVAFRVGESENIVLETGLYNLTQNDAPVLVHYGPDRVENWLLVRLEQPEEATGVE